MVVEETKRVSDSVKTMKRELAERAARAIRRDFDLDSYEKGSAFYAFRDLLLVCDVERLDDSARDDYTRILVENYVCLVGDYEGSSHADCAASACLSAVSGYALRLSDDERVGQLIANLVEGIRERALYPERIYAEFEQVGIELC